MAAPGPSGLRYAGSVSLAWTESGGRRLLELLTGTLQVHFGGTVGSHRSSLNATPTQQVSAIARLRSATWTAHQRLEKRLQIKTRFSHLEGYRNYLKKMWGFCAALEAQLGEEVFRGALADYESRRKLPLLTEDLVALGIERVRVASLPHCRSVPVCREPAAAFGCAYVLEGATLGGRTLLPLVESRLGLTAQRGAMFLGSYGEEVPLKWRSFGVALDAWCFSPERQARAELAAVASFEALDGWLCECPA